MEEPRPTETRAPLHVRWLGRIPYRDAWALQKRLAAARAEGRIPDQLLLLEHDPVLTLGRQADDRHVLATPAELARRGIEVLRVERGGEVTWHGPGQLVAYPILRLADRALLVRPLVRALEGAMALACGAAGVEAGPRVGHPGCWVEPDGLVPRKVGALGLRVERGTTYHGIALNVDPALEDFALIDACGMPGTVSTSIAAELERARDRASPTASNVALPSLPDAGAAIATALGAAIGATLVGDLPAAADARRERAALERLVAAVAA